MVATKNILIVSDHAELSAYILKRIENLNDSLLRITLRYTSNNTSPSEMIALGALEINLKDEKTAINVIKSFSMIFSLHCKQIFPKQIVENVLCINFHPGFNPYNRGWYPQAFSIINGLPAGATIHKMEEEIDTGDIIAQVPINIEPTDTSLEAYKKILAAEKELIKTNIQTIIEGEFSYTKPTGLGNYNGIQDYKNLCKLDLSDVDTFEKHLRVLRALSHGNFKNAYFEASNGKKTHLKIEFLKD